MCHLTAAMLLRPHSLQARQQNWRRGYFHTAAGRRQPLGELCSGRLDRRLHAVNSWGSAVDIGGREQQEDALVVMPENELGYLYAGSQ